MSKLQLSIAVGNYDRVRPLMDGAVQIDGVDPVFMNLPPEEIFFRAFGRFLRPILDTQEAAAVASAW